MKKILFVASLFLMTCVTYAQDSTHHKKDWSNLDLSNRANDHFMLQYGMDGWSGTNDSTAPSGFSRHFNFYFMIDKPFKTNPHMSLGFGAGLGSSNYFFKNTNIDLKSGSTKLPFTNVSGADHFSKYKLATFFLEAPIELRYAGNPQYPEKGFKFALGVKIGTLLSAHTKGKNELNSAGTTIYGPTYIAKESNKRFINNARFAVTARIGFGNLSLDGSYQVTDFLKPATGPVIHPYSIGLTLSGL